MPKETGQFSLDNLISDPIVQLTMRADGVDEAELRALLARVGWKIGAPAGLGQAPSVTLDRAVASDRTFRRGVGIMLLNPRSEVFVGRRVDVPSEAWQMPQGGIEPGEEPRHAVYRELREEIGTDKAQVIAESIGWHRYELPVHIRAGARHGEWRGQEQKWFVMRFTGTDADICVNTEHPEFSDWKWVSPSALPDLAVEFKRQIYVDLLSEFGDRHFRPPG